MADIIGATIPYEVNGQSILPLVAGTKTQDHLVIEISWDRAVVTEDYKYIFKPQGCLFNAVSSDQRGSGYPSFNDWEQFYEMESHVGDGPCIEVKNVIGCGSDTANPTECAAERDRLKAVLACHQGGTGYLSRVWGLRKGDKWGQP